MNHETSLKDAINRFHQEQRQAALIWAKNNKKPNESAYVMKFQDRFDYFA